MTLIDTAVCVQKQNSVCKAARHAGDDDCYLPPLTGSVSSEFRPAILGSTNEVSACR